MFRFPSFRSILISADKNNKVVRKRNRIYVVSSLSLLNVAMIEKQYFGFVWPLSADRKQMPEGLLDRVNLLQKEGFTVFKIQLFYQADPDFSLSTCQQELVRFFSIHFSGRVPAISIAVQPPVSENLLEAELWCVPATADCRFDTFNGLPFVEITHENICEMWSSGLTADYLSVPNGIHPVQEAAKACFEKVSELLHHTGYSYDNIFRQWNYVGHILKLSSIADKTVQNYQLFNEIRAVYYQNKQDRSQYPAATGIGMDYAGIGIDFVAVKDLSGQTGRDMPMKSPVQKDAYRYQNEVLVGESLLFTSSDHTAKQAPLFERGRCFLTEKDGRNTALAMISGTASIRGEETVNQNDLVRQTENTLRFIDELAQESALQDIRYQRARMYLKPGQNVEKAVRIFQDRYPAGCLCTVVQAEVCRENLLVEIETDLKATRTMQA